MIEHTTDRLFWTLTSIIVGTLLLTLGTKAFPNATQNTLQPFSGMAKQADTATTTASDVANKILDENNSRTNTSNNSDPDAQAKANDEQLKKNAKSASDLGFAIGIDGNGTAAIEGITKNDVMKNGHIDIPKYMKDDNGNIVIINHIGDSNEYGYMSSDYGAFNNMDTSNPIFKIKSVTLPDSIKSIGKKAFAGNMLTTISIPNSVTTIGEYAFGWNSLSTVNIPNI